MNASRLFKSIFTVKNLRNLYYTSIKYKSAIGIDRINSKVFEKNIDNNLEIICRKVPNGTYHFSAYREKLLSKGANKLPRIISIPTIRDKVVLRALFTILSKIYKKETPSLHELINNVNQTIRTKKYDSVIKMDVEDFYPSIHHQILLKQLSRRIRKKEIMQLIKYCNLNTNHKHK